MLGRGGQVADDEGQSRGVISVCGGWRALERPREHRIRSPPPWGPGLGAGRAVRQGLEMGSR